MCQLAHMCASPWSVSGGGPRQGLLRAAWLLRLPEWLSLARPLWGLPSGGASRHIRMQLERQV